ncbi:MAG: PilZ domain-containing protein [Gammaproteobacteria bacterium]|nr:PilZ domain-containing protein [Gammaproteobacteria bacterium]
MTAEANQNERRQFSRVPFEASVTLSCPAGKWTGKLVDISLKGLLVSRPQYWTCKAGDPMLIEIHPPEEVFQITMEVIVAHAESDRVGLRCIGIDIDSASHLRRLVELNLGDEEILNRELSIMGA